jgi:hypothetical protein
VAWIGLAQDGKNCEFGIKPSGLINLWASRVELRSIELVNTSKRFKIVDLQLIYWGCFNC